MIYYAAARKTRRNGKLGIRTTFTNPVCFVCFEMERVDSMDRATDDERLEAERLDMKRLESERLRILERGGSTGAGETAMSEPEEQRVDDARPSNQGIMARLLSGSFSSASGREGTLGEQLLYTTTQQGGRDEDPAAGRRTQGNRLFSAPAAPGRAPTPPVPSHRGGGGGDGTSGGQGSIYQEPGVAYLTLVSGSDIPDAARDSRSNGRAGRNGRSNATNRAQSRRMSLYRNVAIMMAYAAVIALVVFALTPRKVEIGTVAVVPDGMRWSREEEVYTLRLNVTLPTYNPNFLPYEVKGDLRVMYFDAQAGNASIPARTVGLRERAATQVVVDASRLDQRYVLSVLSQCSLFPHVLTFFLEGEIWARRRFLTVLAPWWQEYTLVSELETWFSVNCGV